MAIRQQAIDELTAAFGIDEANKIILSAREQDKFEAEWRNKLARDFRSKTLQVIKDAEMTGDLNLRQIDFSEIFIEHAFATMKLAVKSTGKTKPIRSSSLSKAPPGQKLPRSMKELRELYDKWRKKKYIPPRSREMANRIKKEYFKRLKRLWVRYGDDFRNGDASIRNEVVRQMKRQADITFSRAKMSMETETTHYYNNVRREIYDQSPDVTHYLFMAIRDHATTKWCRTRHGLVYKKGKEITDLETPAIHWNCRSEMLPLSPANARHQALINDPARRRENKRPEPLPAEWISRR